MREGDAKLQSTNVEQEERDYPKSKALSRLDKNYQWVRAKEL